MLNPPLCKVHPFEEEEEEEGSGQTDTAGGSNGISGCRPLWPLTSWQFVTPKVGLQWPLHQRTNDQLRTSHEPFDRLVTMHGHQSVKCLTMLVSTRLNVLSGNIYIAKNLPIAQ